MADHVCFKLFFFFSPTTKNYKELVDCFVRVASLCRVKTEQLAESYVGLKSGEAA